MVSVVASYFLLGYTTRLRITYTNPSNNATTVTEGGILIRFSQSLNREITKNKKKHVAITPNTPFDVILSGDQITVIPLGGFKEDKYNIQLFDISSESGKKIESFELNFIAKKNHGI